MKVSAGQSENKVCCPHCRQKVTPEPVPPVPIAEKMAALAPAHSESLPAASALLEEILLRCKEKRMRLTETQQDLECLEIQAQAIGKWIEGLEIQPDDSRSIHALADLQFRLFDQLKPLPLSKLQIIDCDHPNEKSLAKSVARTFAAFGWEISLTDGKMEQSCGEEITFLVAPGPVSHDVATIYFALVNSGMRLHSRIDLEQQREAPSLYVHRISNIPRLLPKPISKHGGATSEMRKSA